MAIRYECPCGKVFEVKDAFAGRQVMCPSCRKVGTVVVGVRHEAGRTCAFCSNPLADNQVICTICGSENPTEEYEKAKKRSEKTTRRKNVTIHPLAIMVAVLVAAGG